MNSRLSIAGIGSVVVALVFSLSPARAAVITLSGGDAGEGYAPLGTTMYAYHFTDSGNSQLTDTIQGVPFQPFNYSNFNTTVDSVNVYGASRYPVGAPSIGASSNDLALRDANAMFFFADFPDPHSMTITMSGLVPGQIYQLDLFNETDQTIPTTYTITDGTGTLPGETVTGTARVYYDVREFVIADNAGKIVVVATTPSTAPNATLNAFSLTVPEPTSSAMIAIGVAGTMIRRRRNAR